jgi:hypothetical protein
MIQKKLLDCAAKSIVVYGIIEEGILIGASLL